MKKQIMIVDDTGLFRKQLRFILEKLEFEVCCEAHNGQQAINLYNSYKPDLVLLDIQMPVMNGLEALEKLKEINNKIPIVMMTAFPSTEIIEECIQKGASELLPKPIRASDIDKAIKSALLF
jgi:two-component system, chemotaxis family, chemotaxis protein CheY